MTSSSLPKHGVVVVIRRGHQVLLIRRGAEVPFPGVWAPMSGKVEPGEEPAQAVAREAREELGVAVQPVGEVWECASVDAIHQLHWWIAELVDEEAPLRPNPREVETVKWIRPSEFRSLGSVFETDVRFFEEIYPALDR